MANRDLHLTRNIGIGTGDNRASDAASMATLPTR